MKVAIFISGQPRVIDMSLLEHLQKRGIEYDIFIHYWKDLSIISEKTTGKIGRNNLINHPQLEDILIKAYSPKKIVGEYQKKFDYFNIYDDCKDKNTNKKVPQSCAYSLKKCFELCDNPDEYDWLIKTRFDMIVPLYKIPNVRACAIQPKNNEVRDNSILQAICNNVIIDFNKCKKDSVNFCDLYNFYVNPQGIRERGEPMSEFWIVSPENKHIFNYYDDLINCGGHPSNEPIIYNNCIRHNLPLYSLQISHGFNRMYNSGVFIY